HATVSFVVHSLCAPRSLLSFPTRRSSDLDRLDAHDGARETRVELAVPVDEGAQAGRQAVGEHLDDPAEGVAVLAARVDLLDHRRSEEHTSELQSRENLVCRLLLEKKKKDD